MKKRVKGTLKGSEMPLPQKTGYKDTWDTGKATNSKKRWRLTSPDRPSV